MPLKFKRKRIRLAAENYRGRRSYFVTLCFHRRHPFAANHTTAKWLIAQLREQAPANGFLVHAYCMMPDHLHFLAEGVAEDSDLIKFANAFKQETGFQFERKLDGPLWQARYYDHILRKAADNQNVAWYIWMNPVRKGICRTPEEYSFSGSFTGMTMGKPPADDEWSPPWKK